MTKTSFTTRTKTQSLFLSMIAITPPHWLPPIISLIVNHKVNDPGDTETLHATMKCVSCSHQFSSCAWFCQIVGAAIELLLQPQAAVAPKNTCCELLASLQSSCGTKGVTFAFWSCHCSSHLDQTFWSFLAELVVFEWWQLFGTAQTLQLAKCGWWGVSLSCQRVLLDHEGGPQQWVTNLQHFCCSQGAAAVAGAWIFDCSLKDVVWTQNKHFWQGLAGGRSPWATRECC